jgi:hypothetical protein
MVVEEKQVEEVKMLSNKINEPLLDLDKRSLNELINILQSFAMILLSMFIKLDLDPT